MNTKHKYANQLWAFVLGSALIGGQPWAHTGPNTAPVADGGASDTSGSVGADIRLSGRLSRDADNDRLTAWNWWLVSAPAGGTVQWTERVTGDPTVRADVPGQYTFKFWVKDQHQLRSAVSAPVVVSVGADNRLSCGAPAIDIATDRGAFLWQDCATGAYSVRYTAGSAYAEYKASLRGKLPMYGVTEQSVEASDQIEYSADLKRIDSPSIKVSAGRYDGLDFSATADSQVCFDVRLPEGAAVHVGPDRTPLVPPFDIRSLETCRASGIGAHTGHYVAYAAPLNTSVAGVPGALAYAQRPGVQGLHVRYYWRDLEPRFGVYDFSKIRADLNALQAIDRHLIVMVMDRSYNQSDPTPSYFSSPNAYSCNSAHNYACLQRCTTEHECVVPVRGRKPHLDGYVSKRWNPWVAQRMLALFEALAAEFDGHPNFEGAAMQETALGQFKCKDNRDCSAGQANIEFGYTPERYRITLGLAVAGATQAFKKSQFFWYANFFRGRNGYVKEIADYIHQTKPGDLALGGPDVTPEDEGHWRHVTPFYRHARTAYPGMKFCSMQKNSYQHVKGHAESADNYYLAVRPKLVEQGLIPSYYDDSTGSGERGQYYSMEELFGFAVEQYGCNYVFWNENSPGGGGRRTLDVDGLAVIGTHPDAADW